MVCAALWSAACTGSVDFDDIRFRRGSGEFSRSERNVASDPWRSDAGRRRPMDCRNVSGSAERALPQNVEEMEALVRQQISADRERFESGRSEPDPGDRSGPCCRICPDAAWDERSGWK